MPHIQPDTELPKIPQVRLWIGIVQQFGTSAPTTLAIIKNTLGGTITWTRTTQGIYVGTITGAGTYPLKSDKTFVLFSNSINVQVYGGWNTPTSINVNTIFGGSAVDSGLIHCMIEIRDYKD